jgi:hypothetical protein
MKGRVESGQLCTVEPVDAVTLEVDDIVLCKVKGHEYLHIIKAIEGPRFQIGNNRGRINGWISANGIYGRLRDIRRIDIGHDYAAAIADMAGARRQTIRSRSYLILTSKNRIKNAVVVFAVAELGISYDALPW